MTIRVLITGMTGSHLVPPLTLCGQQGGPGEAGLAVPQELRAEDSYENSMRLSNVTKDGGAAMSDVAGLNKLTVEE